MQEPFDMSDEPSPFESRLAALKPADVAGTRDRLMFEAGRRSARRSLAVWRGMAALLAIGIGVSALRGPGTTDKSTEGPLPAPSPAWSVPLLVRSESSGESAYWQVRRSVLTDGLNALPVGEPAATTRVRPPASPIPDSLNES